MRWGWEALCCNGREGSGGGRGSSAWHTCLLCVHINFPLFGTDYLLHLSFLLYSLTDFFFPAVPLALQQHAWRHMLPPGPASCSPRAGTVNVMRSPARRHPHIGGPGQSGGTQAQQAGRTPLPQLQLHVPAHEQDGYGHGGQGQGQQQQQHTPHPTLSKVNLIEELLNIRISNFEEAMGLPLFQAATNSHRHPRRVSGSGAANSLSMAQQGFGSAAPHMQRRPITTTGPGSSSQLLGGNQGPGLAAQQPMQQLLHGKTGGSGRFMAITLGALLSSPLLSSISSQWGPNLCNLSSLPNGVDLWTRPQKGGAGAGQGGNGGNEYHWTGAGLELMQSSVDRQGQGQGQGLRVA